jgi:hypothetical protein
VHVVAGMVTTWVQCNGRDKSAGLHFINGLHNLGGHVWEMMNENFL